MDRYLLVRNNRRTRGHEYKLKKDSYLNNVKKFIFPNRSTDSWSELDTEVVQARYP